MNVTAILPARCDIALNGRFHEAASENRLIVLLTGEVTEEEPLPKALHVIFEIGTEFTIITILEQSGRAGPFHYLVQIAQ